MNSKTRIEATSISNTISNDFSRRNFLKGTGAASVIGLSRSLFPSWMPQLAFRDPPSKGAPGHVLVVIFQRGGMDGLNAVVPFGEGRAYYDKRRSIGIAEPGKGSHSAIDLDGFFGLHPSLRPLKDIYDAKHLKVIHAAGSPDASRSHFDAMENMERGTPGEKMLSTGWINRHLQAAAWENDSPFRAVGMGAMVQGSLRGPVSALSLKSISDFHLNGNQEQISTIQKTLAALYNVDAPGDALAAQSSTAFKAINMLSKLAESSYTPVNGVHYPDGDFGLGMKQVAQLIKADVGLEVACVDIGGWDTHEEQGGSEGRFAGLLGNLAEGLAAFYHDLGDSIDSVTVVTMSEFGRRAEENASKGTDHGHGNCMFVIGGGITGSGVHSRWPGLAPEKLDDGDLAITTDYRDVLGEILSLRVGNTALDKIFPGYKPNFQNIVRNR